MSESVYRAGTPKWRATQRWGFWVDAFSAICQPDNMALTMGPLEYLAACDSHPREMAIFRTVQGELRRAMKDKIKSKERQ